MRAEILLSLTGFIRIIKANCNNRQNSVSQRLNTKEGLFLAYVKSGLVPP